MMNTGLCSNAKYKMENVKCKLFLVIILHSAIFNVVSVRGRE
jgi:hypothetical protein